MKTLVVYDSMHGNTEAVARAIAGAIPGEVLVLHANAVKTGDLKSYDLVVVGAPTHGGRASEAMQGFLTKLGPSSLEGVRVAGFDTRIPAKWVKIFGYAGPKIANALKEKGGVPVGTPGGFLVKGRRGPLLDGELERAAAWAREIAAGV